MINLIDKLIRLECNFKKCDTLLPFIADGENDADKLIRLPEQEEKLINKMANRTRKTKTAVILEAVAEKLGTFKNKKTTCPRFIRLDVS